jgi:hypothetical protein
MRYHALILVMVSACVALCSTTCTRTQAPPSQERTVSTVDLDLSELQDRTRNAFRRTGDGRVRALANGFEIIAEERSLTLTGGSAEVLLSTSTNSGSDSSSYQLARDGKLERDLGVAVELIENLGTKLEQSWLVPSRPSNSDPLTVSISMKGVEYHGSTDTGLRFLDAATGAALHYGHGTWIDATGRRTPIPSKWVGGHIELSVPSATLLVSTFPCRLDPVISPEFAVGTPTKAPGEVTIGPKVACGPSQCLVTWIEDQHVLAARFDKTSGALESTPIYMGDSNTSSQARLAVAARGGSDYLVVWFDFNTLLGRRVDVATGSVLDPSPISFGNGNPAVAAEGQAYLVARTNGIGPYSLYAQRLVGNQVTNVNGGLPIASNLTYDSVGVAGGAGKFLLGWGKGGAARVDAVSGALLDSPTIVFTTLTQGETPAVTFGNGVFFLSWSALGTLWGARIQASDGALLDPDDTFNQIPGATKVLKSGSHKQVHASYDGANAIVTWEDGVYIIARGARIDLTTGNRADGTDGSNAEFTLADINPLDTFNYHAPFDISFGGANGFVVWLEDVPNQSSEYGVGHFLTGGAGVPQLSAKMQVSFRSNDQNEHAVASTGNGYMVLWTEETVDSAWKTVSDVYVARFDLQGNALDPVGIAQGSSPPSNPSLSSNGSNYVAVWAQSGNPRLSLIKSADASVFGWTFVDTTAQTSNNGTAVACDGDRCLVAWCSGNGVRARRIDASTGQFLDPTAFYVDTDSASSVTVAVDSVPAPDMRSFLVAYRSASGVRGHLVRAKTASVIQPEIAIGGTPALEVGVASDGDKFFVAWSAQNSIIGTRVDALTGTVLDAPNGAILANLTGSRDATAVTWDGYDYLVTWLDDRYNKPNFTVDVFGSRVTSAASVLDGTPQVGGFSIAPDAYEYSATDNSIASSGNGRSMAVYNRQIVGPTEVGSRLRARLITNAVSLPDAGVDAASDAANDSGAADASSDGSDTETGSGGTGVGGAGGSSGQDGAALGGAAGSGGAGGSVSVDGAVGGAAGVSGDAGLDGAAGNPSGGVSGQGGNAGSGSSGVGGSSTGGTGATGSGGTAGDSGALDGGGGGSATKLGSDDDGGCGCRQASSRNVNWALVAFAALLLAVRRRGGAKDAA